MNRPSPRERIVARRERASWFRDCAASGQTGRRFSRGEWLAKKKISLSGAKTTPIVRLAGLLLSNSDEQYEVDTADITHTVALGPPSAAGV